MSKRSTDTEAELESGDERLGHSAGTGRTSAHENTRRSLSDARGLTESELIANFRNEMYNNVLPAPPQIIEGYHLCWGSTTNQTDTIARRQLLGYEIVRSEEMPGFEHVTVMSGNFQGSIGCNEMLLMKLPLKLYYAYMHIAHHERPMEHQNKMRSVYEGIKNSAQADGVPIQLADGSQSFCAASVEPRPMFTE